eukprot:gene9846-10856_t
MEMKLVVGLLFFVQVKSSLHRLHVGVLIEQPKNRNSGMIEHAAVDLAIKKANNNNLLEKYKVEYFIGDSGCSGQQSVGQFARLFCNHNVDAIIGPSCNTGCLSSGLLATYHNLATISHKCSTAKLSVKSIYPTFGRVRAFASSSIKATAMALGKFFQSMKWAQIGIIHSSDESWATITDEIKQLLQKVNIKVIFDMAYIKFHVTASADACMKAVLKSPVRIVLVLANGEDILDLATSSIKNGLSDGKYVFITLDLYTWESKELKPSWLKETPIKTLTGWFDVSSQSLSTAGNEEYSHFHLDVQHRLIQAPFYFQTAKIPLSAFYIHDAVMTYVNAIDHLIKSAYSNHVASHIYSFLNNNISLLAQFNKTNITMAEVKNGIYPGQKTNLSMLRNFTLSRLNFTYINSTYNESNLIRNGSLLAKQLHALDFQSVSGRVKFDELGNRLVNLVIRNFIDVDHVTTVARYNSMQNTYQTISSDYIFANSSKKIPPDKATCGFLTDLCPESTGPTASTVLLAVFGPISAAIVLAVLYHRYKKRKFENDIFNNKGSFLKLADLVFLRENVETDTLNDSLDDLGSIKNDSVTDKDEVKTKRKNPAKKSGQIAIFKHDNVFVKKLDKTNVSLNRDVLLEIKLARDIHHTNVNPYLGIVVEPPHVCIVSPYCIKGSLRDILSNEDITLDWVFRNSFASDISEGMVEIHDAIGPMGNLTSHNVLIDRRWTCRIADYGLEKFKENQTAGKYTLTEEEKYQQLLWKAPELLSLTVEKKSKQGDVYAYGIMLSEIITRLLPYENYGYPTKDIIQFVQRRCLPPFRPHVRLQSGLDGRMVDMMRRCWHEFPAERPAFTDVRKLFRSIMKDRRETENLVDNMLAMMEKHTKHLEKRCAERTEQLTKEKEKVESLLYTMLPKSVAHRLKMGEVIKPETFQSVSILITDIVDFSSITAKSTPMQVITLFNDMYHNFDNIIDRFEVFKLDNENEKYLIISGCPKRNGIRHVKNVAMLALKLMAKVAAFEIKHRPHEMLRMRICCHTGPVVGGVVGMKTPRYCVYGDSMSYVRHLAVTGPPLRIQISPEFKTALNDIEGFHTVLRGPVRVKGRGLIVSHFLVGKEGMDIVLPIPEDDKGIELKDLGNKKE